jgi:hypothetical protein
MGWSCDVLGSPQGEFNLRARGLLRLFYKSSNHYDSPADRSDVKRPGDSVAARQPQFPQLPLKVFYMRLAQALQARCANAFRKSQKPRLHVRRKTGDLSGNDFIQDFDSPCHGRLYLNFEINGSSRVDPAVSPRNRPERRLTRSGRNLTPLHFGKDRIETAESSGESRGRRPIPA